MTLRPLSTLILAAMLASAAVPAYADDAGAPLAPGKPAGVAQAQVYGITLLYLGIGAAAIAGLVLATNSSSATSTSGTGH